MNIVVEFAGYVVLATVLFGLVLGFFLIRGYLYQPRPVAHHPPRRRPPNQAVGAARAALEQVKRRRLRSQGAEREGLEREERRLEIRISLLEKQVYANEQAYELAFKRREVAWLRWKELYDRVALRGKKPEPEVRELLREAEQDFRTLNLKVEDEWHKLVAHDLMNLEELKGQDVLTQAPDPGGAEEEPEAGPLTSNSGEEAAEPVAECPPAGTTPTEEQAGHGAETPAAETAPGEQPGEEAAPGLRQADFADSADSTTPKAGRRYLDASFDLTFTADGALRSADLSGVDFTGVRFRGQHLHQNSVFAGARLKEIELEALERPHQFVECDFSGVDFSGSRLNHAIFSHCDLTLTRWGGAHLERVKFTDCRMEAVQWEGADLSRTVMSPEMIASLDFSGAGAPPHNAPQAQGEEPGDGEQPQDEGHAIPPGRDAREN